jgi:hypothetical protein
LVEMGPEGGRLIVTPDRRYYWGAPVLTLYGIHKLGGRRFVGGGSHSCCLVEHIRGQGFKQSGCLRNSISFLVLVCGKASHCDTDE